MFIIIMVAMLVNNIDLMQQVLVVAEIGNNHEGSFILAEELIGRAAEAGVQAVKFQTFLPEHYVWRRDAARLARLHKFALSPEQFERLAKTADRLGLLFFSTPFDLGSAEALNRFCPIFKIASGDNNFLPLIERIASFRKPILLSTGLAALSDLERAHGTIKRIWEEGGYHGEVVLLHCVASYPAPAEEANLLAIRSLAEQFGCIVGYSDHTLGIDAAVLSVALGARVIEKHFTLDKNYSEFRDHQLSADPLEMAELVRRVKEAATFLGDGRKKLQASEEVNRVALRRSIAASCDLPAGTTLRLEHLTWVRPGSGIPPGREATVLGRTLQRTLLKGDILQLEDLA
jgi:N-acetylneuraminate synthase/N,N'-diacetyllegionaminate synthase